MMPPVRSRVYGFSLLLLCCASSGTTADRRVSCVLRYSALPDILPTNEKEPKPTGGSAHTRLRECGRNGRCKMRQGCSVEVFSDLVQAF